MTYHTTLLRHRHYVITRLSRGDLLGRVWKPIATISFPRSRVPEEGEKTRRRENERARKRENELVFSFSRNNKSTQKVRKNAATRIRTIESATHANPCFRFRVPVPLFVSFPRPSLFRFRALLCFVFSC